MKELVSCVVFKSSSHNDFSHHLGRVTYGAALLPIELASCWELVIKLVR